MGELGAVAGDFILTQNYTSTKKLNFRIIWYNTEEIPHDALLFRGGILHHKPIWHRQSSVAGGKDHSLTFVLKEDETDKNGRVPPHFRPPANALAPTPSSLS